ncbi:cell wall biogenesis protein [Penicillium riverlandense]|uniref:cell wall biogenesis protein n=1 Tax=Penicillium riverlandense TaxID=1903569 RepID=UPI0025486730|nr:cell wall biogenesis protein [Penicillium riverlandense]KAJ5815466.1 cell wall biogenesis protein [Penicillium riverlandense]
MSLFISLISLLCLALQIGSQSSSFSHEIAGIKGLVQESGLKFHMHATGTIIVANRLFSEGPWDEVFRLIGVAHTLVHHSGISRIQTDVRIMTRYDLRHGISYNFENVLMISIT